MKKTLTNLKAKIPSLSVRKKQAAVTVASLTALLLAEQALAGTGGSSAFSSLWDLIKGWMQGTLGKIISGAFLLIGIIAGAARQSLMAFAVGIGAAVGLYFAPGILEGIVTATLDVAPAAIDAASATISNGVK